jgi:hypothetical protein
MPLHFVGINGAPRRYPHLRDSHVGWVKLSRFGVLIGIHSIYLIFFSISMGFVKGRVLLRTQSPHIDICSRRGFLGRIKGVIRVFFLFFVIYLIVFVIFMRRISFCFVPFTI